MSPLVSIIIPCHNAAGWVARSIQSALDQTYRPLEVIVIDDGSIDSSLDEIKSFGDRITWETGPHCGLGHARNRGLELAQGDFLQYLDADGCLLPEKISRQMRALRAGETDLVYEDWPGMEADPDDDAPCCAGKSRAYPDILEALLANWVPPDITVLYRRQTFERNIRWNERLPFASDWDLHIRLAMAGVTYGYLPGRFSFLRCPPMPAVATRGPRQMEEVVAEILQDAETRLRALGTLTDRYRRAMAGVYLALACGANRYFDRDRGHFEALLHEAQRLSPVAVSPGSLVYTVASQMFGVRNAERMRSWKRRYLTEWRESLLDCWLAGRATR